MKKTYIIKEELEKMELCFLDKIIQNKNFLSKKLKISKINKEKQEELINLYLIRNDEKNLHLKIHKFIISNLIYSYFLKINIKNKYKQYFECFEVFDELFPIINNRKVLNIIKELNENEIVEVSEQLHISYLNSKIEYKNGNLLRKNSKINFQEKGAVYTDEKISKKITEKTIKNQLNKGINPKKLKILDFGCGTGSFYINAFNYLVKNLKLNEKDVISNNLFGIDIDDIAIDILKLKVINLLNEKTILNLKILSDNILCKNMLLDKQELISVSTSVNFNEDFINLKNQEKFNVIISNPPYFLLKINNKNYNTKTLKKYYSSLKNKINDELNYFRKSGLYKYSTEGMLNYYKLSIERIVNIADNNSEIGIICPATLFGDLSSKKIRKWILKKHKLREIEYFAESDNIFKQVTQSTVIFYLNKNNKTNNILINIQNQKFNISLKLIEEIFGENYEIPYINQIGWNILKKISSFNKIKDFDEIRNKRGEFDLTIHKKFITNKNTGWKLIRGKMLKESSIEHDQNEYILIEEFLNNKSKEYITHDFNKNRLICQQVSNVNQKKRLNFVISNKNDIIANSCNYISLREDIINNENIEQSLLKIKNLLNSYLFNWRFKITSSNNHINNYELDELPMIDLNKIPNLTHESSININIKICKLFNLNRKETYYILKDFYSEKDIINEWVKN